MHGCEKLISKYCLSSSFFHPFRVVFSSGMCVRLHFFPLKQKKNVMWVMYTLICSSLFLFSYINVFLVELRIFCLLLLQFAWIWNKLSENIFVHFFFISTFCLTYKKIYFEWFFKVRGESFYVQSWVFFGLNIIFCECLTKIF